ncbi:MAG: hypothetical protein ACREQH_07160, partial [Candidatus Binatus sp.]
LLFRRGEGRDIELAAFIALLGFFFFAPRMHERYEYAVIVFLVPIALESPVLTLTFALVTAAFYSNLLYVMRVFEDPRFGFDNRWIVCGVTMNLAAFAGAVWFAFRDSHSDSATSPREKPKERPLNIHSLRAG